MADTPTTFTAASVREMADTLAELRIDGMLWCEREAEALRQFAARLEQDEQLEASRAFGQLSEQIGRDMERYEQHVALIQAREEGRRSLMAEIAKMREPIIGDDIGTIRECAFCGGRPFDAIPHDSNCLYLKAFQATRQEPVTP